MLASFSPERVEVTGTPLEMSRAAAGKAFIASTLAALPPGPLGLATILPELVAVTKIQVTLIHQIAAYHNKSAQLNPTLVALVFASEAGVHAGKLVVRSSAERIAVRLLSTRAAETLVAKLSERVGIRITSRLVGRWIPVVLAPVFGAFSRSMTLKIGKLADEMFSKDIRVEQGRMQRDSQTLHQITAWFDEYVGRFTLPDARQQRNIQLKIDHTRAVCTEARALALAEGFSGRDALLAQIAGLLHDVGRFQQFRDYGTFRDGESINHGELGQRILMEERVLEVLSAEERDLVLAVVRFHNAYSIPEGLSERTVKFLKLVRDADKLDIWRVVLEFYEGSEEDRASAVGLGLPTGTGYSQEVIEQVIAGRLARLGAVATMDDFRVMQLGWAFDLNFAHSREETLKRRYMQRIASFLPQGPRVEQALARVLSALKGTP